MTRTNAAYVILTVSCNRLHIPQHLGREITISKDISATLYVAGNARRARGMDSAFVGPQLSWSKAKPF